MSSKDSILASIRHHTGTRHEMPEHVGGDYLCG